jgi:hypothetical protein
MVLTNCGNISPRPLASIPISLWKPRPHVCPFPRHRQWRFSNLTPENESFNQVPDRGMKRRRGELDDLITEKMRLAKMAKHAPSSLSKPSAFQTSAQQVVACNRPFDADTIPITLLQEEFGLFMDDCKVLPSPKSHELLQALTVAACKWYENKTQRRSEIQKVFDDVVGLYLSAETIGGTEYTTDGNLRANIMPAVIRECKNEAGCGLLEAIAYYVQFLVKALDRRGMCNRFPCILLIDTGKVVRCISAQCLML